MQTLNLRDIFLALSLAINIYSVFLINKVYALSFQAVNVPTTTTEVLKKINELQVTRTTSPSSAEPSHISDVALADMIKKSVTAELAASGSKPNNNSGSPLDATKLKLLQDRIDDFQKKFSDKLNLKGGMNVSESPKMEQLKMIGAQIKQEVLNECKKR